MNTIKIIFSVDGSTKSFEVQDVYPYMINPVQGKLVLRVIASEDDASYDDIYALKNCSGIIDQYNRTITVDPDTGETIVGEWVKTNTYEDYNSEDISIMYVDGTYTADITHIGKFEAMSMQNAADITYISIMADIPLV